MAKNPNFLKTVRLTHLYLGVFIAPALLFFAITGFVQTFSLHESTRGSDYKPPKILVELGQLHKKQTLAVQERPSSGDKANGTSRVAGAAANRPSDTPAKPDVPSAGPRKNLWPMKLFFALVAVGLATSTLSGLYMAYKYGRNVTVITALWLSGIIIPVLFTFF